MKNPTQLLKLIVFIQRFSLHGLISKPKKANKAYKAFKAYQGYKRLCAFNRPSSLLSSALLVPSLFLELFVRTFSKPFHKVKFRLKVLFDIQKWSGCSNVFRIAKLALVEFSQATGVLKRVRLHFERHLYYEVRMTQNRLLPLVSHQLTKFHQKRAQFCLEKCSQLMMC